MLTFKNILETNYNKHLIQSRKDIDHLHNKLVDAYPIHSKNSKDELNELEGYTDDSARINSYLWEDHKEARHFKVSVDKSIQHIDNVLESHKTPHKLSVYSGMKENPKERMNDKGIFHHPAYLSTSIEPKTAVAFSRSKYTNNLKDNPQKHILKIHVPKDHPGAYIDHISSNQGEHEFLLPRGLNLKYKGTVKHLIHEHGEDIDIHEHHMDII